MRVALAQAVAGRAVLVERAAASLDGARDVVGQVALVRAALQQLGPAIGRQIRAVAQGAGEVRGRLAMGPEHGRPLAGGRGVAQHGAGVVGTLGVVHEAGGIGVGAVRGERRERLAMQRHAPVGRERVLDGDARDLVAEAHRVALGVQHPRRQAGVEIVQLAVR